MQNIYVIKKGANNININGYKIFSKSNLKIFKLKEIQNGIKSKQEFFLKKDILFFLDGFLEDTNGKKLDLKSAFKNFNLFEINKLKKISKFLKGSFNLMVHDFKKNITFICRDIDGLLPLYYRTIKDDFIISNSPEKLKFNSEINKNFCKNYLSLRYNFVYGNNETFIKQIKFLEASTYILIKGDKLFKKRYWDKFLDNKKNYSLPYDKAKLISMNLMKKTFKECKYNLNNTILALSGGLDSTTVAAVFKNIKKPLKSFTAYYQSKNILNEIIPAKAVAKKNCKNFIRIKITSNEFLKNWKTCYDHFSFPLCTSSFMGYFILYKKIKRLGYKNIINAGNADHYFLGNFPGFKYFLADLYFSKNKNLKHELNSWIKNFSTKEFPKNKNIFMRMIKDEKFGIKKNKYFITPKPELVGKKFINKSKISFKSKNRFSGSSFMDAYLKFALWNSERQPGLLPFSEIERKTGILSKDPFSNTKLKEFFFNLNINYKIKDGYGKRILRDLMRDYLPSEVINNKSKIGFNVPFFEWIKSNKKFRLFVIKQLKLFKKTPFSPLIKIDQLILKINSKEKITIIPGIEMLIWQITNLNMWLVHPKNKFIKRIYK
jgi:asparagine synthase (glutamine-hydrolysing)